ncbi:MAG: hypothetical protein IV098_05410 [Thiobacillus sp.]|nr:hypothetical protein [Thiobacillus sp.]
MHSSGSTVLSKGVNRFPKRIHPYPRVTP